MNEAGLVAEARAGSTRAFGAIYDRHAGGVYDFLRSVVGDDALAAEVLRDTFVAAGSRLHQLPRPAKLRPWLYAVARHQAQDRLSRGRRLKRWRRRKKLPTAPKRPAAAVVGSDERSQISRALAEVLNRKERVVLDLHLRQGLEGQELAEALGVSARQASPIVRRLRQRAEREVGLLVVARTGRQDCKELATVLAGRAGRPGRGGRLARRGRLTRRGRRRVARHVELCHTCLERRRKVATPLALLSALPPVPPPAGVRDQVLNDVRLASHRGRAWRAARGGFPPPMVRPRRRRAGLGAAAAAVVVAAVAAVLLVNRDGDDTRQVTTEASPADGDDFAASPDGLPPFGEDLPGLGPDGDLGDLGLGDLDLGELDGLGGLGGFDDGGDGPSGRSGGETGSGGGGGPGPAEGAPAGQAGADTGQPSLGRVEVYPTQIVEDNGAGGCGRAARSITTRVVATPPDPGAVRSITVSWAGPRPGSKDLAPNGEGGYEAVIGPFDLQAVAPGGSVDVGLTVRRAGGGEHAASFTLRSCD